MQRRRLDLIRSRLSRVPGRKVPPATPRVTRKRRVPRREIEARRQRMLRIGVGIAAAAIVAVLGGAVLYENVIKPNQSLASVGSHTITRQEYWKSRAYDLYEQAQQYQQLAQFVPPEQQGQYLGLAQQSLELLPKVWGSTDVDPTSLQKMIDNQTYMQGLPSLGLSLTPEEIETFALNRFAPPDAPLIGDTPTPTLTAERADMATSTAAAGLATPVSPVVASPSAATPAASTPVATPIAGLAATPVEATLTVPATPGPAEARATAEAGFDQFGKDFFNLAHMSREDYEQLIAAPALARQKVQDALADSIGQSAPQVRAAHILVPTREAAEAARERVTTGGEDFGAVAREVSTDTSTAQNGGELGWFTRQEMVAPFADAAFSLQPGEISEPVQSEYGWHIIHVEDANPNRSLTDEQISRLKQASVDQWLSEQRAALHVSSTLPPSPTPGVEQFQPPAGAPTPPIATPVEALQGPAPVSQPSGTPVG